MKKRKVTECCNFIELKRNIIHEQDVEEDLSEENKNIAKRLTHLNSNNPRLSIERLTELTIKSKSRISDDQKLEIPKLFDDEIEDDEESPNKAENEMR
jgi:hypothetical protein